MNKAIKKANGDLIISWQDYTFAPHDTLEKFAYHFESEPKTLVTAVGDKYDDDNFTNCVWKDPRKTNKYGSYYNCAFNDIEYNLCSVPKSAFYSVGGYDERLDKYSSVCGLDVSQRLAILGGWNFKIDQTIESKSLVHGRLPNWEENNPLNNGVYHSFVREYMKNPILTYLVENQ